MDLSGFQAAAAPPPVEPSPRGAVRSRGGGAPARGRRGAPARAGRRGRHAEVDEPEEDGGRGRRGRGGRRDQNPALLWGSLVGVVVAVLALVLFLKSRDKGPEGPGEGTNVAGQPGTPGAGGGLGPAGTMPSGPGAAGTTDVTGGGTAPGTAAGTPGSGGDAQPGPSDDGPETPATPARARISYDDVPIPEGKTSYTASKAELKTYPWPDDVDAETRNRIDQAVEAAVEYGGRDGKDAEDYLVSVGLAAAGRLIGEFKRLKDQYGFDNPDGASRAMVVDRTLRRIDGVMERYFKERDGIRPTHPASQVERIAKRWNWWWDLERYKKPVPPWDPLVDSEETDPLEGGAQD